jgi:alkanesulfonate monooxygenase SsuD/methylene tetrahydromethanopterin reductase-like flavin-dependent oxidoreductase (luciferase family)
VLSGNIPHAGVITEWDGIAAVVRRADELGFDEITIGDHLQMDFGEIGFRFGTWECLSLLTAIGAVTSRIRIAPLVAATAFRHPAMIAKIADTIDRVSGGRLVVGLGAGWYEPEFDAYGFPFDHRVDRFEEAIQIILPLLRGECVTFEGRYHHVRNCELFPAPRPGGPPIMIGAKGPRMMALAARYADVWDSDLAPDSTDPASLRSAVAAIEAACREAGRDPASLRRATWIHLDMPGHSQPEDHPLAATRSSWGPAQGTPEELADLFRGFAAEGFSRVSVWLDPCTVEGVEALAEVLEVLDRG